jgi:hypothetical protein
VRILEVLFLNFVKMVSRIEPRTFDSSIFHKDCVKILEEKQWTVFFLRHNEEIALQFALIFDGSKAIVGEI